jgi:hypothetical protein
MITSNNILVVIVVTVGLKGIWGMEQLDKTGIATWKLGLILMGTTPVVSYILIKLLIGMEPNPIFGPMSQQAITGLTFGIVFVSAVMVVTLLALARAIEVDLKALASVDSVVDASIERLKTKPVLRVTCFALGLLYGYLQLPIMSSHGPRLNLTVLETFIALTTGGPDLIYAFIINPITGLLTGMCCSIVISQVTSLSHAARHIKIDFLQLSDYAAIANTGVRLFLCFIPLLSIFPLMMMNVDDPGEADLMMRVFLMIVLFAVAVLLPYVYPIWILRNRISDKKIAEMGQITLALRGDKEAVKTIYIHALDAPTTAADLLTHRMFLDSLWEWPIASHVQKLVLFGLLPPLAWVLAAMIENTMY